MEQGTDCESVYVDSNSTGHPNSVGSVNGKPTVFEAAKVIRCSTNWTGHMATNHEMGIRILRRTRFSSRLPMDRKRASEARNGRSTRPAKTMHAKPTGEALRCPRNSSGIDTRRVRQVMGSRVGSRRPTVNRKGKPHRRFESCPISKFFVYAARLQRLRGLPYKQAQRCSTHWRGTELCFGITGGSEPDF
jgi:hypothetical protein